MSEFHGYSDFDNNVPAQEARVYLENLISIISYDFNYNDEDYECVSHDEMFFFDPETSTGDCKNQLFTVI